MRVEFLRSGGFAAPAMRQTYKVDSEDLSASEAEELKRLVGESNLAALPSSSPSSQSAPDAFSYRITVDDGDRSQTIRASDAEMPPSLQPLIDWLTLRASSPVKPIEK